MTILKEIYVHDLQIEYCFIKIECTIYFDILFSLEKTALHLLNVFKAWGDSHPAVTD